jgi:hypothetical protein
MISPTEPTKSGDFSVRHNVVGLLRSALEEELPLLQERIADLEARLDGYRGKLATLLALEAVVGKDQRQDTKPTTAHDPQRAYEEYIRG